MGGRDVDHRVVAGLTTIVVIAVVGVIVLALLVIAVEGRVLGDGGAGFGEVDEVVAALGQIAAAGVGALAGYFTARVVHSSDKSEDEKDEL